MTKKTIASLTAEVAALTAQLTQLKLETAQVSERAAMEIRTARAQRDALIPAAEAYEAIKRITFLFPQGQQGQQEDFAAALVNHAAQLRGQTSE